MRRAPPVALRGRVAAAPGSLLAARHSLRVWAQACRVKSLAISTVAVAVGAAVALHEGAWSWRVVLAWLGAVAAQAGTNLTNVSHNYKTASRTGVGPRPDPRGSSAVVRSGLLSPERVRRGGLACFAAAVGVGVALTLFCGWPILALGVPGLLAGYFYSAPPARLAYRALGVATVFGFMGPVMVAGTYYAIALRFSAASLAASVPIGLLAAAVMHTNDLRDYDSDVAHGKRTLSTLVGRERASRLLTAMLAGAYVAAIGAVATGLLPWTTLATLVTVPRAVTLSGRVARQRDAERLNEAWFLGVRLHARFGVLLVAALLATALLPG